MANAETTSPKSLTYAGPLPRRRSRRRLLVWAVGVVVIGGMLISVLLPSLCRAREPANRIKCASNLRQIGQAITAYAQDNGGHYPPSLAVLLAHEDISAGVMVCPSSNDESSAAADTAGAVADLTAAETNAPAHKHCLSYIYTGRGLTIATASETSVVMYEPLENHEGEGASVLFGDGHVDWLNKREWPKVAAAAGVAIVPSTMTTQP